MIEALVWATAFLGLGSGSYQQPTVFRVDVEAIQVDVYVERQGRPLLELTKEDFELYDNGVKQHIELADMEAVPLSIALVLDTSDSVAGIKLIQLQDAAHSFLNGLGKGDRVGLVTFSHRLRLRSDLTSDLESLHRCIDGVAAGGSTVWHDALFAGLRLVEFSRRPLVLLFTDGEDTYSWLRKDQLPSIIEQSHAVVYAVHGAAESMDPRSLWSVEGTSAWKRSLRRVHREREQNSRLLRELAEASGGRLIETASQRLEDVFTRILEEMKTRYLLTYQPSDVAREGWHEIEVKLKNRKADIRARRGYYCCSSDR